MDDAGFTKCERCGQPIYEKDLLTRFNVCPHCEFHFPLPAPERIRLLTDSGSFEERDRGMTAGDLLGLEGYEERLSRARMNTRVSDAGVGGVREIGGRPVAPAGLGF